MLVLDAFEKQHKSVYKLVNTEKDKAELETQTLITELKSNLDEYKTKNDEKLEKFSQFRTSFNNDWDDFEKEVEKKDIIIEKIKRTILKVENDPNKAVNLQYFKCINDNIKNIISNKNISKKDESTKIKEIAKSCFNMKVNSSGLSEVSNNQELVDSLKSSLSKDTNLVKCILKLLKEKYDIQSSTNLCNTDTLNITTGGNSASNYDLQSIRAENSKFYSSKREAIKRSRTISTGSKIYLTNLINKTITDNHQFINNQSSILQSMNPNLKSSYIQRTIVPFLNKQKSKIEIAFNKVMPRNEHSGNTLESIRDENSGFYSHMRQVIRNQKQLISLRKNIFQIN